jgi:hypothetical protein
VLSFGGGGGGYKEAYHMMTVFNFSLKNGAKHSA